MYFQYRSSLLVLIAMVIALGTSGCYTRLGQPGLQTSVDDDGGYSEYYYDEETDEVYLEGEGEYDEDDVVYHRHDHYMHGGYAPLFLDTWWYEPYWDVRSRYWSPMRHRHWGFYDPYWDWYDPYFGVSIYYGHGYYGHGFSYCPYCPPFYGGGWAYYSSGYGGAPYFIHSQGKGMAYKRRDFDRRTLRTVSRRTALGRDAIERNIPSSTSGSTYSRRATQRDAMMRARARSVQTDNRRVSTSRSRATAVQRDGETRSIERSATTSRTVPDARIKRSTRSSSKSSANRTRQVKTKRRSGSSSNVSRSSKRSSSGSSSGARRSSNVGSSSRSRPSYSPPPSSSSGSSRSSGSSSGSSGSSRSSGSSGGRRSGGRR